MKPNKVFFVMSFAEMELAMKNEILRRKALDMSCENATVVFHAELVGSPVNGREQVSYIQAR